VSDKAEVTTSDQPCDECVAMEKRVLIGAVVAGLLLGAGAAIFVLRR
jgi:hypothetical protein